ncbi:MAG: hypothetical protein ACERKO_02595 [Acetanaerobacterium sp.]
MTRNLIKKTIAVNRGTVIGMLIVLGIELLGLCAVIVATAVTREYSAIIIAFCAGVIFINLWPMILFCVAIYTSGYTAAVTTGMPRRLYMCGAYLLSLAYTGVTFVFSVTASLFCLGFLRAAPQIAEQRTDWLTEIPRTLAILCTGQVLLFLLYIALGMIFSALMLRWGAKMASFVIIGFSMLFMLLPKVLDLFNAIPEQELFGLLPVIALITAALVGALTYVGHTLLKRQTI